jgi:diacylglycerol kinase family enzyme
MGHLDIARYMGNVLMGRHTSLSDVVYFQAKKVRVESEDEVPVEVDGELSTILPVTFRIVASKLNVMVPAK